MSTATEVKSRVKCKAETGDTVVKCNADTCLQQHLIPHKPLHWEDEEELQRELAVGRQRPQRRFQRLFQYYIPSPLVLLQAVIGIGLTRHKILVVAEEGVGKLAHNFADTSDLLHLVACSQLLEQVVETEEGAKNINLFSKHTNTSPRK